MTAELGDGEVSQILTWLSELDGVSADMPEKNQASELTYNETSPAVKAKPVRRTTAPRAIKSRAGVKR
jgi:hypothetical protein